LSHLTIDNSEVSVREPLTQLQIIWAALLGVLVFQEKINSQVILGILTILASGFVLVFKKDFFKNFSKEKHLLLILTYTIFTTLVAAAEKFVMKFTIPEVFMFFSYLMTTLFLLPFVKVNMSEIKDSLTKKQVLFWGGFLTFITYIATLYVYKNFDFAISYPLLKIATPLTAIFGIFIFNEKNMLGRKVLAITLATLGAILVKVSF
jgi:drug/metabolite transporter (DMT)-like permease